jgi:tetratricopeptide (TPR) repeat protein
VIQRLASSRLAPSFICALLVASCAARTVHVPRTLGGVSVRAAFVPPTSYEAHVRGELLLAEGRAAEAVHAFALATSAPDEDPYLLSRLAYAQLLAGDREEAARTLDAAARLDPCSEPVWLTRGALAERERRLADAHVAYARASNCAPRSPEGQLALARLLQANGEGAAALDVLAEAAERPFGERAALALSRALGEADPAALAHALASLGTHRAPDSTTFDGALSLALSHDLPRLALRARAQQPTRLTPAFEAALLAANGARAELAALLSRTAADDLGGPASTARLALTAGDYERAELESSAALERGDDDELRTLHAEALLALGQVDAALADARAIRAPATRRTLLLKLLAHQGAPALAKELAAALSKPASD